MRIVHNDVEHSFALYTDENEHAGEITYLPVGKNEVQATHTVVPPQFGGKGYAALLLNALVEWATAEGIKIIPVCSYVVRAFEKNPDQYEAVVKKYSRLD